MTAVIAPPPTRRSDLVIRPIGAPGRYVVKDARRRDYFELGEEEHFLLLQFDGKQDARQIRTAFETHFAEPLSEDDLEGFVELARAQGLLEDPVTPDSTPPSGRGLMIAPTSFGKSASQPSRQSLLYWRKNVFDPDRFFNWVEPKIRFLWTRGFLILSAGSILMATLVLWTGREQLTSSFHHALRWETVVVAWLTLVIVGLLHEFAHGLTCKHYGGEVREIGFLLMYFMPCFYCNVSDAWLFQEKSKRLWVTFAGGYFELFLWSLAVFVWRITLPGTLINYLAFLVLTISGVESFFNFNPLIKLDGYYLLSDWLEMPNLYKRSFGCLMSRLRRLLWGGPRPESQPGHRFLLAFGLTSWLYSLTLVSCMLIALYHSFRGRMGILGVPLVGVLGLGAARGLLGDLFRGELIQMIRKRHLRTLVWTGSLAGMAAATFFIPLTEQAGGEFEIHAKRRAELRAAVAGFLQTVHYEEGESVSGACVVAELAIPDLASRRTRKEAELCEAEAKLKLLQAGPRPEEIVQQQRRVEAVRALCAVAARSLESQQESLEQEQVRFEMLLAEYRAESDYTRQAFARQEELRRANVISEDEFAASKKALLVACARYEQAVAEKRSLEAQGTLDAESELAQCERELAHEQAVLALLEAGSRPEVIEAAAATASRLREELSYIHQISRRLALVSPVMGVVTTSRLRERIGDYFEEGELVCQVEDTRQLEVVIALEEDRAARVRPGQAARLKARSLPFEVLEVKVERVAPRAEQGQDQVRSKVKVYCSLDDSHAKLRPGMTGYARIRCRRATVAKVLATNALRFLRTEFWW